MRPTENGEQSWWFVLNHTTSTQQVTLPGTFYEAQHQQDELVTGLSCSLLDGYILEPIEVSGRSRLLAVGCSIEREINAGEATCHFGCQVARFTTSQLP